jgi:DNA-binding MarR family transcriptional regulator
MPGATEQLINEVRLLYQSLIQIGEEIHQGSNISMGMRAVLEYLDRNGAATVPQVARARRVTRQRIQTLVNALLAMNLVENRPNPASRRSPLISLSTTGAATILDMRRREGREMNVSLSDRKILAATETLSQLRLALEAGLEGDRDVAGSGTK